MKPLLLSLAISMALFSQPGRAADPVVSVHPAPTQIAVAAQDLRLKSPSTRTSPQLAAVDGSGSAVSSRLVDAPGQAQDARGEGLPSTPIALATLVLMFCILVGRRNT
jgi:hypothetical protein